MKAQSKLSGAKQLENFLHEHGFEMYWEKEKMEEIIKIEPVHSVISEIYEGSQKTPLDDNQVISVDNLLMENRHLYIQTEPFISDKNKPNEKTIRRLFECEVTEEEDDVIKNMTDAEKDIFRETVSILAIYSKTGTEIDLVFRMANHLNTKLLEEKPVLQNLLRRLGLLRMLTPYSPKSGDLLQGEQDET